MKSNKNTSFIIIAGALVLGVFIYVAAYNMIPKNRESNSYYVKVGETMSAKIDAIEIEDNTLTITTLGDAKEYCVKSTRTTPENNNLCWKNIENNTANIQIYSYKQYFIWIKDTNGNISSPMRIAANKEKK